MYNGIQRVVGGALLIMLSGCASVDKAADDMQGTNTNPLTIAPEIDEDTAELYASDLTKYENYPEVTGILTPQQTVLLFKMAAEAGHASSQYVYGIMHVRGIGMEQDEERALYWLRKAADQGLDIAYYALSKVCDDSEKRLSESFECIGVGSIHNGDWKGNDFPFEEELATALSKE